MEEEVLEAKAWGRAWVPLLEDCGYPCVVVGQVRREGVLRIEHHDGFDDVEEVHSV